MDNHHHSEEEQAAILKDIARNGATDEYDYGNEQSMSHGYQDLDDPSALLGSIASYEHPENDGSTTTSHDHFASLLQAATTATQAEAAQTSHGHNRGSIDQSMVSDQFGFPNLLVGTKRKRGGQDDYPKFVKSKLSRSSVASEEEETRTREIWGPEEEEADEPTESEYQQNPAITANARAVGVHSAAALFRRPSSASKKYTRPPMSKLFISLELTPEQFIHLQAAAKNYMLDVNHQERSNCVGGRGKGDTDMTKLKLFECVKSFLEDEGWGERCFGQTAPRSSQRKLKWPEAKHKVIAAITPLLRRMVTNERQRLYALESRKTRNEAKSNGNLKDQTEENFEHPSVIVAQLNGSHKSRPSTASPSLFHEAGPELQHYHYEVEERLASERQYSTKSPIMNGFGSAFPTRSPDTSEVRYFVNILKKGERLKPRFTLTPTTCPGFSSLVQHVQSVMDDGRRTKSIQVLGPNGLVDVADQYVWMEALESIKKAVWMDGDVKCVVVMEGD